MRWRFLKSATRRLVLFSGASLSVSRQVGRAQAEAGRRRGVGPFYPRILDFDADAGPQIGVWLGRALGPPRSSLASCCLPAAKHVRLAGFRFVPLPRSRTDSVGSRSKRSRRPTTKPTY